MELWKDLYGYEGIYQVSSLGNIKRLPLIIKSKNNIHKYYKEMLLKPSKTKYGYLKVSLTKYKKITYLLHRLVALTFIDNPENKPQVNHKDANKSNNNISNLEWVTSNENIQHAYRNGLIKPMKGILNGSSVLNENQVLEIRKLKGKMFNKDIAKIYNCGSSTISRIFNNITWKHIQ